MREIKIELDGREHSVLIDGEEDDRPPLFVVGLATHYHDKFSDDFRLCYRIVFLNFSYWTDLSYPVEEIDNLTMDHLIGEHEELRIQLKERFGDAYQRVFAAGHSTYGLIALAYGEKYPQNLYGLITMGTPLTFDPKKLEAVQEDYLNSNFGSIESGGPDERWEGYYWCKAEKEREGDEVSISNWYGSMRHLLWMKPKLWESKEQQTRLWAPWKVEVINSEEGICERIYAPNSKMIFHFLGLTQKSNWLDTLWRNTKPILWFDGLWDSRVSIRLFEDMMNDGEEVKVDKLPNNLSRYVLPCAHWHMFPGDTDVSDFNRIAIGWGYDKQEEACLGIATCSR